MWFLVYNRPNFSAKHIYVDICILAWKICIALYAALNAASSINSSYLDFEPPHIICRTPSPTWAVSVEGPFPEGPYPAPTFILDCTLNSAFHLLSAHCLQSSENLALLHEASLCAALRKGPRPSVSSLLLPHWLSLWDFPCPSNKTCHQTIHGYWHAALCF